MVLSSSLPGLKPELLLCHSGKPGVQEISIADRLRDRDGT